MKILLSDQINLLKINEIVDKRGIVLGLRTYISHAEKIFFLIHAIFEEKSVMYLQTTTIHHVNFYMPNTVLRQAGRLFYAGH